MLNLEPATRQAPSFMDYALRTNVVIRQIAMVFQSTALERQIATVVWTTRQSLPQSHDGLGVWVHTESMRLPTDVLDKHFHLKRKRTASLVTDRRESYLVAR